MATGDWAQEGGFDAARSMLDHYDPVTRTWDLERASELWDAVTIARSLGGTGRGRTVAIVDDEFDIGVPALAEHTLAWAAPGPPTSAHGTVVALLVLEVAPDVTLLLYPAKRDGHWQQDLIVRALEDIATTDAAVVNLSLGKAFATSDVFPVTAFLRKQTAWSGMTEDDVPFWFAEKLASAGGRRAILQVPHTEIGAAAARLAEQGRVVVAAAGNAKGHVYSPALERGVFSAAFLTPQRAVDSGAVEQVVLAPPTYAQSEHSDFGITQPAHVLGSSFATPLLSGLASLMAKPTDLAAFRDVAELDGYASGLYVELDHSTGWQERRQGVVDRLYVEALHRSPHDHMTPATAVPCPECSLLASSTHVNLALLRMAYGDLDVAQDLLTAAERFAPLNPHAAANLGMVHAFRADRARGQTDDRADWGDVAAQAASAAAFWSRAVALRPGYAPYAARVHEMSQAAADPRGWPGL